VRLLTRDAVVDVDTESLHLRVTLPSGRVIHLGALRAGLEALLSIAERQLDLGQCSAVDQSSIIEAVYAALRRSAARAGQVLGPVEIGVSKFEATPLIYSFGFLADHHLLDDARRSRACRLAIARVEDAQPDDLPFPEQADRCVEQLRRWHGLYRSKGSAKRSVNRTLAAFGDVASAHALWGLRRVTLTQPLPSLEHLEVLGSLGAVASRCPGLAGLVALVADAPAPELNRSLEKVMLQSFAESLGAISPPHLLAEVMAAVEVEGNEDLERCVDRAIEATHARLTPGQQVARPPIPLPSWEGYTFLATTEAIKEEGRRMRHCVGLFCGEAIRGQYFFFHVEQGGLQATVTLDPQGQIVESLGPDNSHNLLTRAAARRLAAWGWGFRTPERLRPAAREARERIERWEQGGDSCFPGIPPEMVIWASGQDVPTGV